MAEERNEYTRATGALKRALKEQGITYRDLASGIGLSESGVKKILSAEDGSFQRLSQMCGYVGMTVGELLEKDSREITEVTFPEEVQEFFIENPDLLELYWRLVYEREPLESIERTWGGGKTEVFKLLRRLDRYGLLRLLPEGRVRIPRVRQIRWVGDGPLIRKLYREWGSKFFMDVAKPDPGPGRYFLIRYFKVSQRTYDELINAQRALEAEFVRRATLDMRTESANHKHLRWVVGIDNQSFLPARKAT
jgi:transcriptional regulator with XRE-family HTH domain